MKLWNYGRNCGLTDERRIRNSILDIESFFLSILGITTVLTLSTIALESRTDLPKVHYATALDWFIICSFGYCIATLLEFAGVHYFTKVGNNCVEYRQTNFELNP